MPQIRGVFRKNRYFLIKNWSFLQFSLGRGAASLEKIQDQRSIVLRVGNTFKTCSRRLPHSVDHGEHVFDSITS